MISPDRSRSREPELTADIWGAPWRPCAVCSHPTPGYCPSRAHRALCAHLERDPDTWAPLIRVMPAERREPRVGHSYTPLLSPAEPDLPSFPSMVHAALGAAGRVTAAIVRGEDLIVDSATQEARLAICRVCDHYRPSDHRCGAVDGCGCWLVLKVRLRTERCPLNPPKWS